MLPVIKGTKTKKSVRTVILPKVLVGILKSCEEKEGFICGGELPWTWTVLDNIKRRVCVISDHLDDVSVGFREERDINPCLVF